MDEHARVRDVEEYLEKACADFATVIDASQKCLTKAKSRVKELEFAANCGLA